MKIKVIFLYIGLFVFLSNAFAQTVEIDGIAYNLSSDLTASVTEKSPDYSGDITIPSTVTFNGINYRVTSIGNSAFYGCAGLTSITIPNSVTSIGSYAFQSCDGLTSITIPNSVTSIGYSAFDGCTGLTSITIPNSVTYIGGFAFYYCSGLTSITIPNSVTSIDWYAFAGCTGLTSITIPNSVTSIGYSAFRGCAGLTSIIVELGNSVYDSRNNCNAIIETSTNTLIAGCKNTVIPNSVTSIGNSAFYGCDSLTSITIPNSVTSIGNYAFGFCAGLTSIIVELGNSVYDSRNNCNAIIETSTNKLIAGCKNTVIPNSVTSIGDYAFYGCRGLTSITIPNSVTSIGDAAFEHCSGLTSITIPNSVTSIGEYAFFYCRGLTSITIHNSVTSIGDYAFFDCDGLTSITIPNSVTSIGGQAFFDCDGLTSITIPNSVTSMGNSVFPDNGQLSFILVDNATPPIVSQTGSYSTSFYNSVNLCVPAGSINTYRNASFWGNFQNINPLPSVTVQADHGDATISYHSLTDAEVLIAPHYGYHFKQWSDGNTDNPRNVIVAQNATYTAEFAKNSYKITTQSTVSQVCAISAPMQAEYLDTVEIVVSILDSSYRFRYWNDGNTENPRRVVLTQDTAFIATVSNQYVLSGVSEHGTITGAGEYPYGSYVMLAVIPDNGYKFLRWSDGTIYNPYSLVLEKDVTVEAIMEPLASEVDEHESDDHSATKIMKDGAIYIIKNGQMYNLYGTLIEGTE